MLPFEFAALSCAAAVALVFAVSGRRIARPVLAIAVIVSLGLLLWHVQLERRHWQMWPHFIALGLLGFTLLRSTSAKKVRWLGATALILVVFSGAMAIALPMFQMPRADGPYRVGTMTVHLIDQGRHETHSHNPASAREINVQLWYPTDVASGARAPYRHIAETTLLSSYQSAIETEAFQDTPVSGVHRSSPVIVFNHAWNGLRTQNTFETIDLASHGFIVASIDHTYNAMRTAFPDGRVITASSGDLDDFTKEAAGLLFDRGNAELRVESADNSFLLDTLQRWNEDASSPFHGKIDLSRIAVIGHSFGGAVAIQTAISDPRVRAAINMDGWVFGDFTTSGLNKPLLQMISDEPFPTAAQLVSADPAVRGQACFDGIFLASVQSSFQKNGGYLLRLRGTKHMDFSDRPLYSPFRKLTSSGTDDWQATAAVIRSYTLRFLQRTLLGSDLPMSGVTSAKPESVELTEWRPGSAEDPVLFYGSLQSCGIANVPANLRSVAQKSN